MTVLHSLRSKMRDRTRGLAAAWRLHDTYHYLLEHPDERHFDRCHRDFHHDSPVFSKRVYENSRRKRFFTRREAYRDWLAVGRVRGLEFNEGMNTYLKVILKIKDEAYLLHKWMDYYEKLVGWHNIIIMDCGSTDENYLQALARYERRVLIFSYPQYYDDLHNTNCNLAFYNFVSKNCRYLCVVDADEFIFGYRGGTIGRDNVLPILAEGAHPVYPGTWYANVAPPVDRPDGEGWTEPLRFDASKKAIASGTFSGKSIIRSDACLTLGHIGHNLHARDVAARIQPATFGRIGVLHVSNLGPDRVRARVLKHLKAKGLVPADLSHDGAEAFLEEAVTGRTIHGVGLRYAKQFLEAGRAVAPADPTFETRLMTGPGIEWNPEFQRHVEAFDFSTMLPS